jgi:hypothetical protein
MEFVAGRRLMRNRSAQLHSPSALPTDCIRKAGGHPTPCAIVYKSLWSVKRVVFSNGVGEVLEGSEDNLSPDSGSWITSRVKALTKKNRREL